MSECVDNNFFYFTDREVKPARYRSSPENVPKDTMFCGAGYWQDFSSGNQTGDEAWVVEGIEIKVPP